MLKTKKIKQGNTYAIHNGDYAGQMFVFIKQNKKTKTYSFLGLPDMTTLEISQSDFDEGIRTEIVQFVEATPRYVFKVILNQYEKNQKTKNENLND